MSDQDKLKQPGLLALFSIVALGLASLVIWLLRLTPGPKEPEDRHPPPDKLPQNDSAVGVAEVVPQAGSPPTLSASAPDDQAAPPPSAPSTRWTAPTRYLAGVGLVLFFLWLVGYSQQTLTLLVFAVLIAILSQPVVRFFQQRVRFSQGLAVLITYLLVTVLVVALPLLIVPSIIHGINALRNYDWQSITNSVSETLDSTAAYVSAIPLVGNEMANSLDSLSDFTQNLPGSQVTAVEPDPTISGLFNYMGKTVGLLAGLLGPLISGALSLIFMLLISMQMSLSSGQIRGWIITPVPERFKEEIGTLLDRIQLVWVSFLHGEFTLMVVMGVLVWLMNALLGTPSAILLGVLSGLLEVIPSLGPIIATIPAAIFALLFGSSHFTGLNPWVFMLIVILGYVLLNLVENQVLVPQILGDAVSLPPLIVLIGVTIAGTTAGIAGVFLATPVMASGREILDFVYRKIIEAPDESPPDEEEPALMDQLRSFVGRLRSSLRKRKQGKKAPFPSKNSSV